MRRPDGARFFVPGQRGASNVCCECGRFPGHLDAPLWERPRAVHPPAARLVQHLGTRELLCLHCTAVLNARACKHGRGCRPACAGHMLAAPVNALGVRPILSVLGGATPPTQPWHCLSRSLRAHAGTPGVRGQCCLPGRGIRSGEGRRAAAAKLLGWCVINTPADSQPVALTSLIPAELHVQVTHGC